VKLAINERAIFRDSLGSSDVFDRFALAAARAHHRTPEFVAVKTSDSLDPLRNEPRFQAIERELKFSVVSGDAMWRRSTGSGRPAIAKLRSRAVWPVVAEPV
jgi:hypothetical protein